MLGLALAIALGLALATAPGTTLVRWRLKFATTNTPITIAAISAAARPAIQNGPVRAGAGWLRAERTRADSAGLGGPDIASKARFRSRRKLSRLISEHLLWREVRSAPPRGWPSCRQALIELSWTASSAAVRSDSIPAASRYAGSSSGSIRRAKASASPAAARAIAEGRSSITAVIMSLSIGCAQLEFGCKGGSAQARRSHRPRPGRGLLHPLFSAGRPAPRVLPLLRVRPRAVRPGVLEHHAGPPIRIDHEPGPARSPLPARRPLLADLPGPDALLLRLPSPRNPARHPDLRACTGRMARVPAGQAEAAAGLRARMGRGLLPLRPPRLHQPLRLPRGRALGGPPIIHPILPRKRPARLVPGQPACHLSGQ